MMLSIRFGEARMSRRSAMRTCSSASSSRIFCALEAGQPLQPQLEDRLGLDLGQAEARDQAACATSGLAEARISAITSSRWSSAIT